MAGCGSTQDSDLEDVATAFYSALSDRDGAAACDVLAPSTRSALEQSAGKPCPDAILEEQLPEAAGVVEVQVFDTAGEVRFDGETTFLGRFDAGWQVVAAGCTPAPPHPYDCTLTGG